MFIPIPLVVQINLGAIPQSSSSPYSNNQKVVWNLPSKHPLNISSIPGNACQISLLELEALNTIYLMISSLEKQMVLGNHVCFCGENVSSYGQDSHLTLIYLMI